MAEQVRAERRAERHDDEAVEDVAAPDVADSKAKVDAADDLLDEIDAILEEDVALTNYTQRGGE